MDDLHPLALECCLSTPYSAAGNTRADEEHYFWVSEVTVMSDRLHAMDPPPKPEKDDDPQPEYSPNDDAEFFHEECRQRKVKVFADAATIFKYESRSLDENLGEERRKIVARMGTRAQRLLGRCQADDLYPTKVRSMSINVLTLSLQSFGQNGLNSALPSQQAFAHTIFVSCTPLEQQLFPREAAFYRLPTVESLWEPEGVVVNPATWSAIVPSIRLEVERQIRHDKMWCTDQLARILHKSRIPLSDAVVRASSQESSPFIDEKDETKGLASLHAQITDAEVDKLSARPVSIFLCSEYCGLYPFADAIKHLGMKHGYFHTDVSCLPAPASYLQLVDDMLERANLDRADTTMEDLAGFGNRFTIELRTGKTLRNQPWKVVNPRSPTKHQDDAGTEESGGDEDHSRRAPSSCLPLKNPAPPINSEIVLSCDDEYRRATLQEEISMIGMVKENPSALDTSAVEQATSSDAAASSRAPPLSQRAQGPLMTSDNVGAAAMGASGTNLHMPGLNLSGNASMNGR
ncbi:hypothetical protein JCM10296v2_003694 [Rhodotorula toruloides]